MMIYGGVFLGMSIGFGAIFEWTLHGPAWSSRCRPNGTGRPGAVRRRRGCVYVAAIVIALFSDIASFVLIAAVAVYYIVERTPASRAPRTRRQRRSPCPEKVPRR